MQSEKAIGNGYHLQLMNGVLFVILFASAAYQLSQWHYISLLGISPLIVGIVLGMIYGNTLRLHLPVYWLPGILFSSKVLLRVAIVLYGFRLTFQDLLLVGFNGLAISSIMLTSTFIGGRSSACPAALPCSPPPGAPFAGPPPYSPPNPWLRANPTKAASPWARSWFSAPSPCSSIPSCTATASST